MDKTFTRYVSRAETRWWTVELSFNGDPVYDTEAPYATLLNTRVSVRCLSKSTTYDDTLWYVVLERDFGDVVMPPRAWNGVSLVALTDEILYVAVSNTVYHLVLRSGATIWKTATGSSPISSLMPSQTNDSVIVFNRYQEFEKTDDGGNIVALNRDGTVRWRAALPRANDIYAGPPSYVNGQLRAPSFNGFNCVIDEADGSVIEMVFTK